MKNFIKLLVVILTLLFLYSCKQLGLYNIFPYHTQDEAKPYLGLRKVYHIENIGKNDFNQGICKKEFFIKLRNTEDCKIMLAFPGILPDSVFFPYSLDTNYFENLYNSEFTLLNDYLKNLKIEIFDASTSSLETSWKSNNEKNLRMKKESGYMYQFSIFISSSQNDAIPKIELKKNKLYKILITNFLPFTAISGVSSIRGETIN